MTPNSPPFHLGLRRLLAIAGIGVIALSQSGCLEKLKGFLPKPKESKPPVALETAKPAGEEEPKSAETPESAALFGPEKKKEGADANAPKAEAFELNKSALVSVLLYHDFVDRLLRNEMTTSIPNFRAQMQALKDDNIPVISMSDLLAWKKGEKNIPDECVVITLDDGWLGQHQLAYPILKEFGYPFTIYLYKKYVNIGGRSMTIAQIKEMLANGAELGSHSISHQPLGMKKSRTDEQYKQWLTEEIVDSKKWLEETFGIPCRTFAYPYGSKNDEVVQLTMDAGYEAAVTVNPQKVTWETPNGKLGRFTQQWDKDTNFKLATSFHGRMDSADSMIAKTDAVDDSGHKLYDLKPAPNQSISDRRPVITANLANLGGVVPDSLTLRVSGFGAVPVEFDASTQTVSYQVQQKLRTDECMAVLGFKRVSADKPEVLSWKFKIDEKALYNPNLPTPPTLDNQGKVEATKLLPVSLPPEAPASKTAKPLSAPAAGAAKKKHKPKNQD
jgi:peptidoglycan/xylan/chitin deacetylase (PgdA/CDA1 family)